MSLPSRGDGASVIRIGPWRDYSIYGSGLQASVHVSRVLRSGRWAGTAVPAVRAKGSRRCGACATRYAADRCGERSLPVWRTTRTGVMVDRASMRLACCGPGEGIAQVRCMNHALCGGPLRRAVPASLADYSDGGDGGSSFHTSRVLWSGRWAGTVVPTVRAKGSRRCGACATRYAAARCGERSLPFSWPGSPLHWVSAFSTPSLRAGMAQRGQRGLSREEIETYLKRLECAGKRAIIGKGNCRA